jgi:hypothetical protein
MNCRAQLSLRCTRSYRAGDCTAAGLVSGVSRTVAVEVSECDHVESSDRKGCPCYKAITALYRAC